MVEHSVERAVSPDDDDTVEPAIDGLLELVAGRRGVLALDAGRDVTGVAEPFGCLGGDGLAVALAGGRVDDKRVVHARSVGLVVEGGELIVGELVGRILARLRSVSFAMTSEMK